MKTNNEGYFYMRYLEKESALMVSKGSTFIVSFCSYEDYSVSGVFVALKDFSFDETIKNSREDVSLESFFQDLADKKIILQLESKEVWFDMCLDERSPVRAPKIFSRYKNENKN